ncbi:MAG: polyphosphate kinase 1 [Planctomycetota bacterium]|jgi:polyphosphate kinase|nr:polyphosphate kinase 1 [Planctomycetota bacterium]
MPRKKASQAKKPPATATLDQDTPVNPGEVRLSDASSLPGAPMEWINRDLSWLSFNTRVLAQAEDINLPLLERVKFLGIVASNLDEFFMVRMAYIRRELTAGANTTGPDGINPRQLLQTAREEARTLLERANHCWTEDLLPALSASGIEIIDPADLTRVEQDFLATYFGEQVLPVLTPMVVDSTHPFPLLSSGAIYLLLRVTPKPEIDATFFGKADTILVQVPASLNRFVRLPGGTEVSRFILLEDVVQLYADEIIGGYNILEVHPFRVTRDAEITLGDDQTSDLILAIQEGLKRSRWGSPVRLAVSSHVPEKEEHYLCERLGLAAEDVFRSTGIMDMHSLTRFSSMMERSDLLDPAWPPLPHPSFAGVDDIFSVIALHDVVVSLPYQSFDPVTQLIEKAADDPNVLAIKITLYRVSGQSPLVRALIRAAEQKKQVTALVELRARFDEEANITWAQRLDAAGAHVVYGVVGYKTHSKAALVIRREEDGIRRYCHLATGNYNDRTARGYTDLGLFTANPGFGSDISAFFNVITGYSLPPVWNHIEMAPIGLRARTHAMIHREIEKHSPDNPGFIRAKMNALIDPAIIRELYRASQAGVKIDLLVRGMCRLKPGVKGLSENIRVRSIVDRFLEHPRIFHYHNGGNEEVFMSSADWMERNMDRRLELLFPVNDPDCRREVLAVLDAGLADNISSWELASDGIYHRLRPGPSEAVFRSQEKLYARAQLSNQKTHEERRHRMFTARMTVRNRKK